MSRNSWTATSKLTRTWLSVYYITAFLFLNQHYIWVAVPSIFVQRVVAEHFKLFPLFHQDIAKRFDRARLIHSDPVLWHDVHDKVEEYFKLQSMADSNAKMGYFLHVVPNRRVFKFNRYEGESVVGVPSNPLHLPAAEPILPGHTLLRPSLSSLKSAVKFPHLENEEGGSGVYGNPSNLGIRYGAKSGRIRYSNNRRTLSNYFSGYPSPDALPELPLRQYYLVPVSLNSVQGSETKALIGNIIENLRSHKKSSRFQTANMYDHIVVSNKPELNDLIPQTDTSRNWWFFNQDDLTALEDSR